MHTSTKLRSADFQYRRLEASGSVPSDFQSLFPGYHAQDRIGVVSLRVEEGVLYTGYTLLALTTAFYDVLRARGTAFFDYPQHFALFDSDTVTLPARLVGETWGNLDVWPDSNWLTAPGTVPGMLRKVFDLQINRLFWPEGFLPDSVETPLPAYMRAMMRSRLKAVYFYATEAPTMEIRAAAPVEAVMQYSLSRLPDVPQQAAHRAQGAGAESHPYLQRLRQVSGGDFLARMDACFAAEEA